jgi:uncharacterized protein (TIGR02231 family)
MRIATVATTLFAFVALHSARADVAAKEIETKSAVVAVLVLPDAATVTREATVTLPAGPSTVVFSGVPYALAPDSLRALATGEGELTIGAVEARAQPTRAKPVEGPVQAKLKELRAARAALEATLEALRAKLAMIRTYAAASPEKLGTEAKPLPPTEWDVAFETIGVAHAKVGEELRLATEKAQALDEEIAGLAGAVGGTKPGLARDVAIGVESRSGGSAKIRLIYRTDVASWRPAYDARLDTGEKGKAPNIGLVRRAVVAQQTGEDWRDVALSVSTVGARRGAAAPYVVPLRVGFVEPVAAAAPMPAPMARAKSGMAMDGLSANQTAPAGGLAKRREDAPAEAPAKEAVADLEASSYAATYKIGGPASVPGNGTSKSFTLASRQFEPKLAILASPGLDPTAYLETRLQNEEEAPLLPGQIHVERDGMFVGASRFPLVASGDSANLGFGVDDKVKVVRVPIKRKENEPTWFGQTKTDTREFKTTVKNLHDFPVNVTVVDQVPFSENSAVVVETLPQTTPPSEKQPDDRRGVMSWSFLLQPGETKELRLAYRLKWPADRDISFERTPQER